MAFGSTPSTANYFIGKGSVYIKREGEAAYRHAGNVPTFELTLNVTSIDHFSSMEGTKVRDDVIVTEQTGTLHMVLEEGTGDNFALALMADAVSAVSAAEVFATSSGKATITGITPNSDFVEGRRYWLTSNADVGAGNSFIYTGSGDGTLETAATSTNSASSATAVAPVAMTVFGETQINCSIKFVGANAIGKKVYIEALNVQIKPSAAVSLIGDAVGNMTLDGDVLADTYGNFAQFYWDIGTSSVTIE